MINLEAGLYMWILDELKKMSDSDRTAVIHRDRQLSFKALWEGSEKIAQYIQKHTVTKNPVLIYGNKDVEIVEIMMGSLKSGRAYVPIDITFPVERVRQIMEITETELIFNISDMPINTNDAAKVIGSDECNEILNSGDYAVSYETDWVQGEDNCYILFTSGSTGTPKGVQISKNNILNFVNWFGKQAAVSGEVVLNQVSYSFDVSVIQLYLYLAMGKTLFSIDKKMISDFGELFTFLKSSDIASWISTPAFIEMCAVYDAFNRELLPKLEKIILAGEVLTKKLTVSLWEKIPGVEVINGYGPTEGTVLLTACTITRDMVEDEENELPIGKILDGAEYTIDKNIEKDNPVAGAAENKGELVVSSASISKGYFKNEEATAKSFFKEENKQYNSYRTGDVVYENNGMIYYCGRKDFQIKLNGYRIELDDISANINKIDGVENNIILPVYRDGRVAYIAAFLILNMQIWGGCSKVQRTVSIRKKLAEMLPSYMIPKKLIVLDKFPLNVNGKIDRKVLQEEYL